MLISVEEGNQNLERLRERLAGKSCCEPDQEHRERANNAAAKMPLAHNTTERSLEGVIASGALLSPLQLKRKPRQADVILKGEDEICFYLGSSAFPDNEYGFLFSREIADSNKGRKSSTPFDSGGCIRRYHFEDTVDRVEHVRSHSMPFPESRLYLADLLNSHFEDTSAYLEGSKFSCPCCPKLMEDPHGMKDYEHGLVRTHEVRIQERVALAPPILIAMLAPKGNVPPFLASLIATGIDLVSYDDQVGDSRTKALRNASVDYILENVLD